MTDTSKMTNAQILMLAAQVSGLDDLESDYLGSFYRCIGVHEDGMKCLVEWNPLKNKGNTFGLMVSLSLSVSMDTDGVEVIAENYAREIDGETIAPWAYEDWLHGQTPEQAVCRAITRAAAEIQLAKERGRV